MKHDAGEFIDGEMKEIVDYLREASPEQYEYVAGQHLTRLAADARWLADHCHPTDVVVDLGSFPWVVPAYLSSRGFTKLTAVDIDRPGLFEPSPKWAFDSVTLDVEDEPLPFADDSVDVVVMFEIFEHLYRRPNAVFREVARVLRPGGRVILSTPNGTHIPKLIQFALHRKMGPSLYEASAVYERLGHFSHLREYSMQELRSYLARFGFQVTERRFRACWTKKPESLVLKVATAIAPTLADNIFLVAKL